MKKRNETSAASPADCDDDFGELDEVPEVITLRLDPETTEMVREVMRVSGIAKVARAARGLIKKGYKAWKASNSAQPPPASP